MRTAALPTFRKPYGKIERDLPANTTITVIIQNNYNTYSFGGKKKLVLSTTSCLGGKDNFLGSAYLFVGGLCLFLAVCFILVYVLRPRWERFKNLINCSFFSADDSKSSYVLMEIFIFNFWDYIYALCRPIGDPSYLSWNRNPGGYVN